MGWADFANPLGSAIDFAGGLIGNAQAADEARKARDWQKAMSDTEMTRRVADLKNAGLNPMLALGHLGGASTGGASAAAQQNPSAGAGRTLAQSALMRAQVDQSKATSAKELSEADNLNARTATEKIQSRLVEQKINESLAMVQNLTSSAKHADQGVLNLRAQLPQIYADVERLKMETQYKEAGIEQLRAETGLTNSRQMHSALDLQRAVNEYEKHKSWVGQTILPWEGPVSKIGAMIGGGLAYRRIGQLMQRGKPWRSRGWKK